MTAEDLKNQVLELSLSERAMLAKHLLASLEDGADSDVESAWIIEARRRREAFRNDEIDAVSAKSAISGARARLR